MKAANKVGLSAFLAVVLFAILVLMGHEWNPRTFILERPTDVPRSQTWGIGYDGQAYYALALDPAGASAVLDKPAHRYMRIVYPLVARVLALGRTDWIPWSMLVLNLFAAGLTAWLLGWLLERRGVKAWWALVPVLSFPYLLGLRMDLTEPLAFALALTGLVFFERGRFALAAGAFLSAGLTKDVALAFPLGVGLWELLRGRWRSATLLAGIPLGAYLIWAWWITQWLGTSPFASPTIQPIPIPFIGLSNLEGLESRVMVLVWAVGPAAAAALAIAWTWWRDRGRGVGLEGLLILVNVALLAVIPAASWEDPIAVLRLGLGYLLALPLWLAVVKPRLLPYCAALWGPSFLIGVILPGFMW